MAHPFIWYELMTTDTDAAETFYRDVVGWSTQPFAAPGMGYTTFNVGSRGVGGMMAMPDDYRASGGQPTWLGYIFAEDVDATAAAIAVAGGAVHQQPRDLPGVGRMAAVADPQGAMLMVMAPQGEDVPLPPAGTPGTIGWRELIAADGDAAFAFYADRLGWSEAGGYDMGPMGTYRLFATDGGTADGGMMTRPPGAAQSGWRYYFTVDRLQAAVERVRAGGGEIATEPHEVPGGGWIAHGVDPQGARFGLLAADR